MPAAIALIDILDGEAARRLTAVTVVADKTHLGILAIGGANSVDIRLRMQHMGEKIIVIPGFDGEVLRDDGLWIKARRRRAARCRSSWMRMTFSTPVTPNRARGSRGLTGRRAWTSLPRRCHWVGHMDSWTIPSAHSEANRTSRCTMGPKSAACHVVLPPRPAPRGFHRGPPTARVVLHTAAPAGPNAVVEGARVDGEARGRCRTFGGTRRGALHGGRGAARARRRGARARLPDVRGDRRLPRRGRGDEGADLRLPGPPRGSRGGHRRRRTAGRTAPAWSTRRRRAPDGPAPAEEAGDRPDRRAVASTRCGSICARSGASIC